MSFILFVFLSLGVHAIGPEPAGGIQGISIVHPVGPEPIGIHRANRL